MSNILEEGTRGIPMKPKRIRKPKPIPQRVVHHIPLDDKGKFAVIDLPPAFTAKDVKVIAKHLGVIAFQVDENLQIAICELKKPIMPKEEEPIHSFNS